MSLNNIIPNQAELVFSGISSRIFQWDQEMYDGSIARFECIRFMDGAFVLPILPDGPILLTLQEQPGRSQFISLPGGSFDFPEESPLDCALRELREETGYTTESYLYDWFVDYGSSNLYTETYFYIARDCKCIGDIMGDGGEKIELFTVSFDQFLELSSDPRFHHHRSMLPMLYEARISSQKKEILRKTLYGV